MNSTYPIYFATKNPWGIPPRGFHGGQVTAITVIGGDGGTAPSKVKRGSLVSTGCFSFS